MESPGCRGSLTDKVARQGLGVGRSGLWNASLTDPAGTLSADSIAPGTRAWAGEQSKLSRAIKIQRLIVWLLASPPKQVLRGSELRSVSRIQGALRKCSWAELSCVAQGGRETQPLLPLWGSLNPHCPWLLWQ